MGKPVQLQPGTGAEEKNLFTLFSKPGANSYQAFLGNEPRCFSLARKCFDVAQALFTKSEAAAQKRFDHLQKLVELYKSAEFPSGLSGWCPAVIVASILVFIYAVETT